MNQNQHTTLKHYTESGLTHSPTSLTKQTQPPSVQDSTAAGLSGSSSGQHTCQSAPWLVLRLEGREQLSGQRNGLQIRKLQGLNTDLTPLGLNCLPHQRLLYPILPLILPLIQSLILPLIQSLILPLIQSLNLPFIQSLILPLFYPSICPRLCFQWPSQTLPQRR